MFSKKCFYVIVMCKSNVKQPRVKIREHFYQFCDFLLFSRSLCHYVRKYLKTLNTLQYCFRPVLFSCSISSSQQNHPFNTMMDVLVNTCILGIVNMIRHGKGELYKSPNMARYKYDNIFKKNQYLYLKYRLTRSQFQA